MKFGSLYGFLKSHKQYVYNQNIPQWSCLCEICENVVLLVAGLNKRLPRDQRLPSSPHDLVERFSCNSSNEGCMYGSCDDCSVTKLTMYNFISDQSSAENPSSEDSSDGETDYGCVKFNEWARGDDGKIKKIDRSVTVENALEAIDSQISILKIQIYVKRVQVQCYNNQKDGLKDNDLMVHVDYSENYDNRQQSEIQSAYFGHSTFSLFTACCYLKSESGDICKESITVTSESSDHSRSAALSCVIKVIDFVREKYQHLPLKINALMERWLRITISFTLCIYAFIGN